MKRNGSRTDSMRFYDFIFISKLCWGLAGGEGSSMPEVRASVSALGTQRDLGGVILSLSFGK